MKAKSLFFDLDNTLINRDEAMKQLILDLLGPLQKEDLKRIMQKDNSGYTKRMDFAQWLIDEFIPEKSKSEKYNLKKHNPKEYTAQTFFDFQIENVGNYVEPVKQAIFDLLDFCKEHFNLFLLSNGGTINQTKKLENSKLNRYFPVERRIISGDFGFHKPDKRIFELLMNQFNLQAEEILMIGDDVKNDIEGANNLGLATCWIANGRRYPKKQQPPNYSSNYSPNYCPNYIVENLSDPRFKKILEEWKEQ